MPCQKEPSVSHSPPAASTISEGSIALSASRAGTGRAENGTGRASERAISACTRAPHRCRRRAPYAHVSDALDVVTTPSSRHAYDALRGSSVGDDARPIADVWLPNVDTA